jgi:hypothetical protein
LIIKSPIASKELKQQRIKICNECPKLSKDKNKCMECGCYIAYKAAITISKCPIQKW